MALELRQQLKLTQQLVMTPQLQQAIKLLQLSRLELAETIQQEIEQNPVLEELDTDRDKTSDTPEETASNEAEPPIPDDKTSEIQLENSSSLSEIDWNNYANEYEQGFNGKQKDDNDLPSRLDILTAKPNLQTHLQWQLNLSHLSDREKEVG